MNARVSRTWPNGNRGRGQKEEGVFIRKFSIRLLWGYSEVQLRVCVASTGQSLPLHFLFTIHGASSSQGETYGIDRVQSRGISSSTIYAPGLAALSYLCRMKKTTVSSLRFTVNTELVRSMFCYDYLCPLARGTACHKSLFEQRLRTGTVRQERLHTRQNRLRGKIGQMPISRLK